MAVIERRGVDEVQECATAEGEWCCSVGRMGKELHQRITACQNQKIAQERTKHMFVAWVLLERVGQLSRC